MSGVTAMGRMDEWPVWQRWLALGCGWVIYLGAFTALLATHNLVLRMALLVVVFLGMLMLAYAGRAVLGERMRKIDRWQTRVMLPAFIAYIVLMIYAFPRVPQITVPWLKVVAALSPVVPMLFVAWALIEYVKHCDELERRQHLEAAGIAVVVVGIASMALGFLVATHLLVISASLTLLFTLPALCCVYGIVNGWAKWRNRAR